jgi:hypothetical protein
MSTKQLSEKFGSSGLKGGLAEEWLYDKLQSIYDTVDDLREDMDYQRRGIDFGIQKAGWRNMYYLDCKGNLRNGRLFLELQKNGRPGWFWKSQADRIYHVDQTSGKAVWYGLPELRAALETSSFPMTSYENSVLMSMSVDDHPSPQVREVLNWM